jgi:transposase
MHKIGEDRSERLDIVPAQLRAIVTVRPKYACRTCTDGVTQAPAQSHLIMGGLPTEASTAHVLVSKSKGTVAPVGPSKPRRRRPPATLPTEPDLGAGGS